MRHRSIAPLLGCLALLALGCGTSDSDSPPAPATEWVTVESTSVSGTSATLAGSAWVSHGYVALRCAGMACFPDTSTDNYPGVDVTCVNRTTGAAGSVTSFYGGGTDWVHRWRATVPVVPGMNTIRISAFDPGGTGGSVTIDVAD